MRVRPRSVLAATVATVVLGLAGAAEARFTCSSNDDCWERAQQCDPGGIPCNDGICNPSHPDADAIGCVLIPNDDTCDDDNLCNGIEYCDPNHGCQDGTPLDCDDDISCTTDSCDPDEGCENEPKNNLCSNGFFCDGTEICDPNQGCKPGTPPNCSDNAACTTDSCDEQNDRCRNQPNHNQCSNGIFCDGVEQCTANGCKPGPSVGCNDGIPCTTDVCNEANDTCTNTPNNSLCTNGQFCDGVETCSPTQGCKPGTPVNCNDNTSCTSDSCNEQTDSCQYTPNNNLCSNGLFCDGVEVCTPNQGCRPGTPPNCGDGVGCTIDRCVEATDSCSHSPSNGLCDDDKFCNGVEVCSPTNDCQAGSPPDCGDDVECTIDRCVEATNSCEHIENPNFCDNGLFCDGDERCDELLDCYFGLPPNCADENECTVDVCVEETDTCSHTPTDDLCSNGLFCDGEEVCSPLDGCHDGENPDCNDDIDCTTDICSEQANQCVHTPDNLDCQNGLFCDGNEVCNPNMGCVPGTPPNCNDNSVCTNDSCYEPDDVCLNTPNGIKCGDGVFNPECGEECDEDNGEICNNDQDDDGDGFVDCADPDCNLPAMETCDDQCRLVPPCQPLARDPAIIDFGGPVESVEDIPRAATRLGSYSFHARMMPTTDIDPSAEGFVITLSNVNGEIWRGQVDPSQFKWTRSSYVYKAPNRAEVETQGGIVRLGLRKRYYEGELGYGIRFKAIGDFSKATLADMATQVYFGDDVGYVIATWSLDVRGRWILRPRDYEGGIP